MPTTLRWLAACDRGLAAAGRQLQVLERRRADAGWIAAMDDLNVTIEDASGPVSFIVNVHPDKAVREAAQACELRWQDFLSTLGQNRRLYDAARRVKPRDAIDRAFLQETIDNFVDAGVGLPDAPRQRAKALNDRMTEVGQVFAKNVRDDATRVPYTQDELAGVPEAGWKDRPRDEQGRVLMGLDGPSFDAVMGHAEQAAARERMYRARYAMGGEANLALLGELVRLRHEYAGLFGYASYDDFVLRRRMAHDLGRAQRFLGEVKAAVAERELRELRELRDEKARHLGTPPEATRIERWDAYFYTERVRRARYSVDQEAFRPYFPPQESLRFVLKVAERLLGVRYTPVAARLWHPDVQAYVATDVRSGKPLATLYVDLYPRDGKYNHAAVWSLRGASTRLNRTAEAALVVNMDRRGLTLDELETLLHELGHALHNNLSATRHASQAGTSVLRDFVEAPSQMLEDWVYDRRVLALFQEVCPACRPVPEAMLKQAVSAREYGKGVQFARQHLYASYDLALHAADAPEPQATWVRMESATPIGHAEGTMLPASFGHLAGGYAAGYYGYLWSLVVAMDLRTAFAKDRLDPAVGLRYRQRVLSQGSQRPPEQLLRDFLGRETDAKAFFADLQK
ncbi:M3 family metallopeptidase [Piscinibacter sakaiensis]|uniref:M3 family metallopeptidase n=1 Tax=Piscinibacter sakaiensis TaxID=1547922 RepID=UPI0037279842